MTDPDLGETEIANEGARPHRQWGAVPQDDGSTRFRVWAPACRQLDLELDKPRRSVEMTRLASGFFTATLDDCGHGTRYRYRLPQGPHRPDPASRFQPSGVHGWSQVVDPRQYRWNDDQWRGVKKQNLIVYELHVGCFTTEGTYVAAIDRLDELVDLGITAIELMPLAQAAGQRNWGYDGVGLFAPTHNFGTPDELRRLVDAAHGQGLAVLLDVVYNHFGPEGNYWGEFGPYLSDKHTTAWGAAPNFDGRGAPRVRDLFVANATYWIDEYHFDGLRIDAAQCINDESPRHILAEMARAVSDFRTETKREIHLIAESNIYDPDMLQPLDDGGLGCDAVWCDDFLHSLFATLRPGDHMSSRQYHPHSDFDATLRRGFVFQGTFSEPRRRIPLEESSGWPPVSLESLVHAIQNHDFIGNHPQGRRLHQLTSPDAQKAAAALLLLHPAIPMLFMGEEFAADNPFFFFVDFGDQRLREAVEQGRRLEHPQHDWTDVESPLSPEALERSKLGSAAEGDQSMLEWYRQLIRFRRRWREEGVLTGAAMSAHWNEEGHFALLRFEQGKEQRFVVSRLHPAGEFPKRVALSGFDEILLQNHCEAEESADGKVWWLGEFGVAIGHGEVAIA